MNPRTIIHLDLDAFFCAVEELKNPSLRTRPFAVGARPESRGVVASCSYSARQFGVKSAMPMSQAIRLCPDLIIVSPRHSRYQEVSEQVMTFLQTISPILEQVSIDEAFLDVSNLSGHTDQIARQLQDQIRQNFQLPVSLGIASNKLVAKIANDVGKASRRGSTPPNAITIVPHGQEAEFLSLLPVGMLWGVGPKTASRLADIGISTIGELAKRPEIDLIRVFGTVGIDLSRHSKGIDDSPLITSREVKSVSLEITFSRDIQDLEILDKTIFDLSEKVAQRLTQSHLAGSTIKIKIRFSDFTTITRQISFDTPFNEGHQIFKIASDLFHRHWKTNEAVRLLGVGVSHLVKTDLQLSLWDVIIDDSPIATSLDRERQLQAAIEEIRARYGDHILQRGVLLYKNVSKNGEANS